MILKQIIILILFVHSTLLPSKEFTLKDLEALREGQSFEELIKKAKEIAPTERSEVWFSLIREATTKTIDFYQSQGRFDREAFLFVERFSSWPELINEDSVIKRRNSYLINYLKNCSEKIQCEKDLTYLWTRGNQSPQLAVTLLKEISPLYPNYNFSNILLKISAASNESTDCEAPFIKNLILKELEKISDPLKLLSFNCSKKLSNELTEALRHPNRPTFIPSFTILDHFKLISATERELFHLSYLLTAKPKGDLFNTSWNTLLALRESYSGRIALLKELATFDPLPDDGFKTYNDDDKLILIKEFKKSFPEYLDFYAKTCLKFYKGKGEFKTGNPTVNCREFFKAIKGTDLINEGLQNEFVSLRLGN